MKWKVPSIPVYGVKDDPEIEQKIDTANSSKAIYVELFGISRKAINCTLKTNKQHELMKVLKTFIYDIQSENIQENINNPNIVKYKRQLSKRLKSSVKIALSQGKKVLKDSVWVNVMDNNIVVKDGTKGRKYSKCRQYRHYAKTCQNA
ncbi:hypothetical protein RhiirA1_480410 [Rhizophagus irregularis]|uniref:Uncharacterized protein n=1 Tax=Rhizophagus irregularis TaxID=588596 RepID=A0A2I1FMC8_9GLOM|nr:hypothetical protein RhiirA1_480410 [Rhizophagus irregularis]PKY35525.1 hypothetical protein RhiirB3_456437 [Rhizophagus irregularis]